MYSERTMIGAFGDVAEIFELKTYMLGLPMLTTASIIITMGRLV